MFMFAVFLLCSVLIACKTLPPIGSRDFQRRQTVARHGTMKVKTIRLNKKVVDIQ